MEIHNGAIFHAAKYLLDRIDAVQRHFLNELGTSESEAFLESNFAPPCLRRDIGVLGLLHKRVLGKCHPIFQSLLPFRVQCPHQCSNSPPLPGAHNKQLYGHMMEISWHHKLHFRSIFAMVYVYNRLPQEVVDCQTVCTFQTHLTKMARRKCEDAMPDWMQCFSCRA